jgi:hypothetical protein
MTSASSMSTSSTTASAGEARDDDIEETGDRSDDGLENARDAVDDSHEAGTYGAENGLNLYMTVSLSICVYSFRPFVCEGELTHDTTAPMFAVCFGWMVWFGLV